MAITSKDFKTDQFIKNLPNYIDSNPLRLNWFITGYLHEFLVDLLEYAIPNAATMDDDVYRKALKDSIGDAEPLRRGYFTIIDTLFSANININIHIIRDFFEGLCASADPELVGLEEKAYTMRSCFHFTLVRHELFLNTVATALKYYQFEFLDELFSNRYLWMARNKQVEDHAYNIFQFPLTGSHFNPDELLALNESEKVDKGLIKADMLCYFAGMARGVNWRPMFHLHADRQNVMLDFLLRMRSQNHCKKVCQVFGVSNLDELKTKIDELKDKEIRGNDFETYPTFSRYMFVERIATEK